MDISRVPDQKGISQLYNMLKIHHSGLEQSIFNELCSEGRLSWQKVSC